MARILVRVCKRGLWMYAERNHGQFFSPLEAEVVTWFSHGKRGFEVSAIIGISEGAVHQHMKRVMDKLGAANTTGAVAAAIRRGYIS